MSIAIAPSTSEPVPERDPYELGWRYVTAKREDGTEFVKQVPLTEWDVLHPEEGDFIVQNYAHTRDCIYIKQCVETVLSPRKKSLVLIDHRVDWQEPGVLPHGPDVTAFDNLIEPWDVSRGTFKVHDMGAAVLLGVEVTSPATWKNDVGIKIEEYHLARIPYYVVVDLMPTRNGQDLPTVTGYRNTPEGFVPIASDPLRGIWIPTVGIGFRIVDGRVRCVDQNGTVIPDRAELEQHVQQMLATLADNERLLKEADDRVQAEMQRAEAEKQRAEAERQRAEAEKQRADDAIARVRQLELELKNSRG